MADKDMTALTPFSDSQFSGKGCVMEARFAELCKSELSMDEETLKQATDLLREGKHLLEVNMEAEGTGKEREIKWMWFAYLIYSAKILGQVENVERGKDGMVEDGFILSQILKALKINMEDFFEEMPQFVHKSGNILSKIYGFDWENRLEAKELQSNFWHLRDLSRWYKGAFQKFFWTTDVDDCKYQVLMTGRAQVHNYQRFGWLLFLALRTHEFINIKDTISCRNGLVSILAILILHVPVCFRKFSPYDYPDFNKGVDLIASLCNIYRTSEDELRRTMDKANYTIVTILKKNHCLALECRVENLNNLNTDGLVYFEDLMEKQSLSLSLNVLEKDYVDSIDYKANVDERVFVNDEDSLVGIGSLARGTININGTKRKFDVMASPKKKIASDLSPPFSSVFCVNGDVGGVGFKKAPATVRTTMTIASWLQTIISSCPSKPSTELRLFLSACDKNLTNNIIYRANIMLEAIFPSNTFEEQRIDESLQSTNVMVNMWAKERRIETMKLYYRVLEKICKLEYRPLHNSNWIALLSNERFHRAMLACSAEIIFASYMPVTMLFPSVLERTGITSFELIKIIETFIICEEALPRELRMRLQSLEERLLESMVWEKGSSMYNSLIVVKPTLSAEICRLGLLAEPMPSLDAISMHQKKSVEDLSLHTMQKDALSPDKNGDVWSPKRVNGDCRSVLVACNFFSSPAKNLSQSAFLWPKQQITSRIRETCAKIGIRVLFIKIMKLACVRIKTLCQRLLLSEQFLERVCCLVQQILDEQTELFFNRHVDQLILCSFFMIAKDFKLSLTFGEIIENYKKQAQCKPHVLENVFVDSSSTTRNMRTGLKQVDLIRFYNEIFVLNVQTFLKRLHPFRSPTNGQIHEDKKNKDDLYASSRQVSLFLTGPDMSPRKVSASCNVYVSPLQFVKMDSLLSSGSRSQYAFIGESTHPYQSHSKDLSVINDHLNCSRKVIRRLYD